VRPLLLLDVDGPLNPWAAKHENRPAGYTEHKLKLSRWSRRRPLRIWLNAGHGPELLRVAEQGGAQLVWATTWEHRANTVIGPAIGLPVLPVIELSAAAEPRPGEQSAWKYRAVARYAAGRPLAWLDDDFDLFPAARDAFLDKRRAAGLATELVRVNPRTGMTPVELAAVEAWLRSL
jgi:hypothetical protein